MKTLLKPFNLIVLLASGLAATYLLFINYLAPIHLLIVFALILGLAILGFFHPRKWVKLLVVVTLLLESLGLGYVQSLMDKIIDYEPTETRLIDFLSLKDSSFSTLDGQKGLRFGISSGIDEDTRIILEKEVRDTVSDYTFTVTDSDQQSFQLLQDGTLDVMIIDTAMIDILQEAVPDLSTLTKSVHQLEKTYVKIQITKLANVTKEPFIVLLSGIDTDGPINRRSRSDVNILLVVNPKKHSILMVPVYRDSYIPLACEDGNYDKLTHAGIYGIECSVKTIEQFLDIDINYYLRVNFTSFLHIIDVMGPINVYSDTAFTSTFYGPKRLPYDFVKGMNLMDSQMALAFVRERHALPNSDVGRVQHQMALIKAMINELISLDTLNHMSSLVETISSSIDTNLTEDDLMKLVRYQLTTNKQWTITQKVMKYKSEIRPTYSSGKTPLYVLHIIPETVTAARQAILDAMANP